MRVLVLVLVRLLVRLAPPGRLLGLVVGLHGLCGRLGCTSGHGREVCDIDDVDRGVGDDATLLIRHRENGGREGSGGNEC